MLFTGLSTQREVVLPRLEVGYEVIREDKPIGTPDGFHRVTIPRHKRLKPYAFQSFIQQTVLTDQKFKVYLQ
jgi:hypothetical protein